MDNPVSRQRYYKTWQLLRRTSHLMHKVRQLELMPYGISGVEAAVLRIVINRDSDVTPAQISGYSCESLTRLGAY